MKDKFSETVDAFIKRINERPTDNGDVDRALKRLGFGRGAAAMRENGHWSVSDDVMRKLLRVPSWIRPIFDVAKDGAVSWNKKEFDELQRLCDRVMGKNPGLLIAMSAGHWMVEDKVMRSLLGIRRYPGGEK